DTSVARVVNARGSTANGRTVSVTGRVSASGNILGYPALTLDDPGTNATEELFVIARPGQSSVVNRLAPGAAARVTGTVRFLTRADLNAIERQAGTSLNPSLTQALVGAPVLTAGSIQQLGGAVGGTSRDIPSGEGSQPQTPRLTPQQVEQAIVQGRGQQLAGRTVTVTGQVSDVLNPNVIALQNDVLVVSAQPFSSLLPGPSDVPASSRSSMNVQRAYQFPIQFGETVQVIGEVRAFNPGALSRELGVDLSGLIFDAWSGRPVMVAQSIDRRADVQFQPGGRVIVEGRVSQATPINLTRLLVNPDAYMGQPVVVTDLVTDVIGPGTFALGDSVLVTGATDAAVPVQLRPGEVVQVLGMLRPFRDAQWDFAVGARPELLSQWVGRPVLVAAAVQYAPGQAGS
ncbi:MAG TPA: hypothetical protein VGW38_08110, partial [Chloroflexota bacterium]|nr:hypothetical protein [Chloroflexota bacterium]